MSNVEYLVDGGQIEVASQSHLFIIINNLVFFWLSYEVKVD